MSIRRPAVFVERDRLLCPPVRGRESAEGDTVSIPDEVALRRDAAPLVRGLNDLGYLCLVVTCQPAIARQALTRARLDRIHERLRDELRQGGASVGGIHVCPHAPARSGDEGGGGLACGCRPPAPGLLLSAAAEHHVELRRSFLVAGGDEQLEAGRRAGVRTIRIAEAARPRVERSSDLDARNLHEALALIAAQRDRDRAERARARG